MPWKDGKGTMYRHTFEHTLRFHDGRVAPGTGIVMRLFHGFLHGLLTGCLRPRSHEPTDDGLGHLEKLEAFLTWVLGKNGYVNKFAYTSCHTLSSLLHGMRFCVAFVHNLKMPWSHSSAILERPRDTITEPVKELPQPC